MEARLENSLIAARNQIPIVLYDREPSAPQLSGHGKLAAAMIAQAAVDAQDPASTGYSSSRAWLADTSSTKGMSLSVCVELIRLSCGRCMSVESISRAALAGQVVAERHITNFGLFGMPNHRELHSYPS